MYRCLSNTKSFIKDLHPLSVWIYIGTLFLLAMTYTHPAYLAMLLLSVLIAIHFAGAWKEWRSYFIFALSMVLLIVLINAFISSAGSTVIWNGPIVPIFGQLTITKEAAAYGLNMGLKILLTVSIFCLYQAIVDIDETLSFALKIIPKSAVVIIMAFLMLPRIKRNLAEIRQVMSARGANFDTKGIIAKIKAHFPLWNILLLTCLEGSWDSAESLHARAFGVGRRTFYQKRSWMVRDSIIAAGCIFSLTGFVFGLFGGQGFFKFYPKLGNLFTKEDFLLISWIFLGLSVIVVLQWSYYKWKFLRLKI